MSGKCERCEELRAEIRHLMRERERDRGEFGILTRLLASKSNFIEEQRELIASLADRLASLEPTP